MTNTFPQVVLVTGGAQGIGKAIVAAFLGKGAHVAAVDRDGEALAELEAEYRDLGELGKLWTRCVDVANESEIAAAMTALRRDFGRLDVLVNNAGVGDTRPMAERPTEVWDRVLAVNLRAPYLFVRYGEELLRREGGGVVVNIASTRALMSEANTEPYAASKGGLLALTHALAVSLGPDVRVNAISPGWIETGEWQKVSRRSVPNHSEADKAQHPVGRVGVPEDIAAACVFLASAEAGFVTGQNFVIDGGMTVKMIYE
ncbi:glucose 1-dehydrogenase [Alicyclobacillus sp. SP_1]|uniref:glucose 1-dehydrogenase n=1 Tax=Alicyclobacillus sp. SP_1 TaxID=2942475 RepID=UPI0021580F14|nr:glucose 1-dehydrogenase [Alicyclobacillus sp. SP_1]